MVGLPTFASGKVTATVGMAWSSVHWRSLALASSRERMPVMTTTIRIMPASIPNRPNPRRDGGRCLLGMRHLRCGGGFGALLLVYHTENHGDKHQCRSRCKDQAADHGAAERRVLLAALAQAQRHRRHADDHRERRHQHRTEPDEAGLQRRR